MKLQNFIVIFIIILIPLILFFGYYMNLEKETIKNQTACDMRLIQSTKQAIQAFEVNTVKWNKEYSSLADSKRRDIAASVNTFITSISNSMGITGMAKESILTYVPAIAYTMYDGLYIYSPTYVPKLSTNENGVTKVDENGNILYLKPDGTETIQMSEAQKEYKHVVRTPIPYSEKIESKPIVINYTIDNYVRIIDCTNNNFSRVAKVQEGYLTFFKNKTITTSSNKIIEQFKFNNGNDDVILNPETLSENIVVYNASGELEEVIHSYIYDENKEKLYYNQTNNQFFRLSKGRRVYLDENCNVGDYNCKYKKTYTYDRTRDKFSTIYQVINGQDKGKWYNGAKTNQIADASDITMDYSAINYYVESYQFTEYAKGLNIDFLKMTESNNSEDPNSLFSRHKKNIMRETITNNLRMAISSYAANSSYNYVLPVLTEIDWDQILNNVSMITFVQGLPIGLKYYNNYAIAISTENKEYVNPKEIYYIVDGTNAVDTSYHRLNCASIDCRTGNSIKGYRNTEFTMHTFANADDFAYYYMHANDVLQRYACYNCLITSYYKETASDRIRIEYKYAYNHAIARERYVSAYYYLKTI